MKKKIWLHNPYKIYPGSFLPKTSQVHFGEVNLDYSRNQTNVKTNGLILLDGKDYFIYFINIFILCHKKNLTTCYFCSTKQFSDIMSYYYNPVLMNPFQMYQIIFKNVFLININNKTMWSNRLPQEEVTLFWHLSHMKIFKAFFFTENERLGNDWEHQHTNRCLHDMQQTSTLSSVSGRWAPYHGPWWRVPKLWCSDWPL